MFYILMWFIKLIVWTITAIGQFLAGVAMLIAAGVVRKKGK